MPPRQWNRDESTTPPRCADRGRGLEIAQVWFALARWYFPVGDRFPPTASGAFLCSPARVHTVACRVMRARLLDATSLAA